MSKILSDVLGLPPLEKAEEETDPINVPTPEESMAEANSILSAMSNSEKIDMALTTITGLIEHDDEMDDIAAKAISTYKDLCDMGENMPPAHAGKVYEVAAKMLQTSLEAKDAKVNKKLKMLDLQLKKMKIDLAENPDAGANGTEFDRNELLRHIVDAQKSDKTDK